MSKQPRKKCPTCTAMGPAKQVLEHTIILEHRAPCGMVCYVGSGNVFGPQQLDVATHGPKECNECGPVVGHWVGGTGAKR